MAKIHIDRAYIESSEKDQDFSILIHIKDQNDHIFAGRVDLDHPIKWIYTENAENGDLMINNSAGMEGNKWNHITREIIGDSND